MRQKLNKKDITKSGKKKDFKMWQLLKSATQKGIKTNYNVKMTIFSLDLVISS